MTSTSGRALLHTQLQYSTRTISIFASKLSAIAVRLFIRENRPSPYELTVRPINCLFDSGTIVIPGIVNRTFENRTQSNSICGLSSIEFGNRTKSNTTLSVSSISEQIEFNRTNRTQSNSIRLIVFD